MNDNRKSLLGSAATWFAVMRDYVRASIAVPLAAETAEGEPDEITDPDFKRWLVGDPMVTGNPASRYGDDAPGYLTGNGLGSLEIGAADD